MIMIFVCRIETVTIADDVKIYLPWPSYFGRESIAPLYSSMCDLVCVSVCVCVWRSKIVRSPRGYRSGRGEYKKILSPLSSTLSTFYKWH